VKRLILSLALVCAGAHAEFKDGNKLYDQMTSGVNSDWFNAIGYITGVADAGRGSISCPPANLTAGQLFDMVKQQMANLPGGRHYSADVIINVIMMQAWPCPKKGPTL